MPLFFNHYEQINGICTKTDLIKTLQKYYESLEAAVAANYTVFDSTPTSFIISNEKGDKGYLQYERRYKEIQRGGSKNERVPVKHCTKNMWLLKPASLNQGRGIEIYRSCKELYETVLRKKDNQWVVQKYIERPLLYFDRKFDLRVWTLVTGDLQIFYYNEGYMRTSSCMYDSSNKNNFVHLTNQCLQLNSTEYGNFEEGNTVSFKEFEDYLNLMYSEKHGPLCLDQLIVPRMKDLIIDTFLSVETRLNPNKRQNCFELFGFDFLVDEDFRVWLIEVNTNPYLGVPNKYIGELLPKMVNEMFTIVLDPHMPPSLDVENIEDKKFELIYSSVEPKVNQRRPFSFDLCYPIAALTPQIGVKESYTSAKDASKKRVAPMASSISPRRLS